MRGLKHNGNLSIETKTGFKGRKLKQYSKAYKNAEMIEILEDVGVEMLGI